MPADTSASPAPAAVAQPAPNLATQARLAVMMFLEFFIWGGWFVSMGSYLATNLGASGADSALAYSTQSWGAIVAPFLVGLIADRYINAERLLGAIHLLGTVLLYCLYQAQRFDQFYPYLLGYMILYMPTLALVNSIAFKLIDDPSQRFAKIRLWGTIGWIIAGLTISYGFHWDSQAALASGALRNTFLMCSFASLLLGLFAFTLPRVPPRRGHRSLKTVFGLDALALLRERNYLVFFCASILICIPLAFYYQHANQFLTEINLPNATGKQTLGQASEILFMLAVPFFLHRWGMKGTLLIGMGAWAARYVLFSSSAVHPLTPLLLTGIALHGACYDFFFVSGQIYTDSKAGDTFKSSAQGLITLATYGFGMLIGFKVAGSIVDLYKSGSQHDWQSIWLYPAAFAAGVSIVFAVTFRNVRVEYRRGAGN